MEQQVKRYYQLKQKQKEIELELGELRREITDYCAQEAVDECVVGGYKVKLIRQERKEFDDIKLYEALPDPQVWRLLSKADNAKITGLIKLGVLSEDAVRNTYQAKAVTLLQVEKK